MISLIRNFSLHPSNPDWFTVKYLYPNQYIGICGKILKKSAYSLTPQSTIVKIDVISTGE